MYRNRLSLLPCALACVLLTTLALRADEISEKDVTRLLKGLLRTASDPSASDEDRKRSLAALGAASYDLAEIAAALARRGLKDPDMEVRRRAATDLRYFGRHARAWGIARVLVSALRDDSPRVREAAAVTLGGIFSKSRISPIMHKDLKIVPELVRLLRKDPDSAVRKGACGALRALGPEAKEAVPDLIAVLEDQRQDELRFIAAQALAEVGPDAKAAVPVFLGIIKSRTRDHELDQVTTRFLANIGTEPKVGLSVLLEMLAESYRDADHHYLRFLAVNGLRSFGPEAKAAVPALIKALVVSDIPKGDRAGNLRAAVFDALTAIGPAAQEAADIARRAANSDESHAARSAANRFLKSLKGE